MPENEIEKSERARARRIEKEIETGRIQGLRWLANVYIFKEEKLYRFDYQSWADFSTKIIGMSVKSIDHKLRACEILGINPHADNLLPQLPDTAKNLPAIRAISEVPTEVRDETIKKLHNQPGPITPKVVRQAAESAKEKSVYAKVEKKDFDAELTERVKDAFAERNVFDGMVADFKRLGDRVEFHMHDPLCTFLDGERILALIENIKVAIRFAKPYSDCVHCQQQGCERCHDQGWITRPLFSQLPEPLQRQSRLRGDKGTMKDAEE